MDFGRILVTHRGQVLGTRNREGLPRQSEHGPAGIGGAAA
jgi:hypothetical protein